MAAALHLVVKFGGVLAQLNLHSATTLLASTDL